MEFKRLADVDIVETANDTDKVLIEQNGEIKRVPKTEVGGSGGNTLIITHAAITDPTITDFIFNANMTLTEAIEAFNKQELTNCIVYAATPEGIMCLPAIMGNMTPSVGFEMLILVPIYEGNEPFFWTADGISINPPEILS